MNITKYVLFFTFILSMNLSADENNVETLKEEEILIGGDITFLFIKFENGKHELFLTEKMNELLASYSPQFKAWETTDYTDSIVQSLKEDDENSAPFAFISDINKDGKDDVIIDGFNGEMPETIAILSNEDGYKVIHVASLHTNKDPKTLKSFNDGVVEMGLNYLLWPNKNPATKAVNIFTVAISQETNAKGELLSDGGIIDYHFIDGEFVPFYPEF